MAYRFGDYVLDPEGRRLLRDGGTVPLPPRYFDALHLLVSEAGALVEKDRLITEVWSGAPVTDEALTQCIRTLRRELGDSASRPTFIETAPRRGYRFIAAVEETPPVSGRGAAIPASAAPLRPPPHARAPAWAAAALGGAVAGIAGGLLYGALAAQSSDMGAASIMLVLFSVNVLTGALGGAGLGIGLTLSRKLLRGWAGTILGLASGGLVVGAVAKLLVLDLLALLFGAAPHAVTGGLQGMSLGGAIGAGFILAPRLSRHPAAPAVGGAVGGGLAGAGVLLAGGALMGGSLRLLARTYEHSRLQLDALENLFAAGAAGRLVELLFGAAEGAIFGACVIGAVIIAGGVSKRPNV